MCEASSGTTALLHNVIRSYLYTFRDSSLQPLEAIPFTDFPSRAALRKQSI